MGRDGETETQKLVSCPRSPRAPGHLLLELKLRYVCEVKAWAIHMGYPKNQVWQGWQEPRPFHGWVN